MARINVPAGDAPESVRLFGVNADMGGAIAGLAFAIYEKSQLPKRVREAVRMRIAMINQCQICLAYRFDELADLGIDEGFYADISNWQESDRYSEQQRLAIEYAERFALDHLSLDDAFFVRLHQHFSSELIFDLSVVVAGLIANGRLLQVLQVEQSCSLNFDESGQQA